MNLYVCVQRIAFHNSIFLLCIRIFVHVRTGTVIISCSKTSSNYAINKAKQIRSDYTILLHVYSVHTLFQVSSVLSTSLAHDDNDGAGGPKQTENKIF